MRKIFVPLVILLIGFHSIAQENVFHSNEFWKSKPSLNEIKQLIKVGNDPVAMNQNGFDATVYAMIRDASNDSIEHLLSLEGNTLDKKTHDSRNYLHWTAYAGNVKIVEQLLKMGSSVTQTDSYGNTPLTFAANAGIKNMEIYKAFLQHGVDLKKERNEEGANILLLLASHLENEKELNKFISYGLSLESVDNEGNNIFHYAVRRGNISFLQLLITKGINAKATNNNGGNAILMASRGARGHQNSLELYQFLENLGIEVNIVGDSKRNPLHAIAYKSIDLELFNYFINEGVDVNLQDHSGNSPFMNTANSNNLEVVEFLFKKGSDINAQNETGESALTMAVANNDPEIVAFLLNKSADFNIIDSKGNSLVYYLVNSYSIKSTSSFDTKLELLQKKGLAMDATQASGNNLYHLAVRKNNLKLIERLRDLKININARNDEGLTALHIAAMKAKDHKIITYLISQGADLKIKTDFEESVYELAMENEHLQKNPTSLNFLK
jgi:ankyrin repeat protein